MHSSRCATGMCAIAVMIAVGCNDMDSTPAGADGSSSGGTTEDSGTTSGTTGDGADSSSTGAPALSFCQGAFEVRYDPAGPGLHAFPDDLWTETADTRTGLRLRSPIEVLAPEDPIVGFPSVFAEMGSLDGFGVTAPAFVRVTGAVDPASLPSAGDETDPLGSSLLLVDLDAEPPAFLPFDLRVIEENGLDDGTTLMLAPLRPLRAGARHAVVMTRDVVDEQGECFAPSAAMQSLLAGDTDAAELVRLGDGYARVLEVLREAGTIAEADELSAAVVYTTATTIEQSIDIAAAIASSFPSPYTLDEQGCYLTGYPFRTCEGTIRMVDFADDDGIIRGVAPVSTFELPFVVYLPTQGLGPFPTVVYGHGLTGDRLTAWYPAAYYLAQDGFAVVAIDAPKHGDHPDAAVTNSTFDLLGLSNDPFDPFDPFDARDNFRQAAFDKLQLVHRLLAGMDVTGDGNPDLDPQRLLYQGDSLGGVMGPQMLALSDAFESATLVVPGGNLTNIVDQASEFQPLVLLVTQSMSDDERLRMLAITQTAIDGGDPMTFAPWVIADRLPEFAGRTPHVLAQMALNDTVVPNSSTTYLVRALGIPIVGEPKFEMRDVAVELGFPVVGNLPGSRTGGLYQYDVMARGNGDVVPATHRELQVDPYALSQQWVFMNSGDAPEGARIMDPFGP